MTRVQVVGAAVVAMFLAACSGAESPTEVVEPPADTPAPGIFAPMGEPLPSATAEERALFARGREVALRPFTGEGGLGPGFNAVTCMACHEKPAVGGSSGRYRDFLMIEFDIGEVEELGVQVLPHYDLGAVRTPTDESMTRISKRNAPALFGTGLLQEVPGEELLRHADPDDLDGDGISGRVNYERGELARFGAKAHSLTVEEFIRAVLSRHHGISSDILPLERKAELPVPLGKHMQASEADDDDLPDPELSEDDLFALISFVMLLAAPEPDPPTPLTETGRQHFLEVGCGGCHLPALQAPRGPIPAYTDLLIHDMGPELADGLVLALATGSEFRTPPLWGVVASGPWLHDGRAETLDEAIRWHGGEAQGARDAYLALDQAGRDALIAFLESLGGRDVASQGMIRPDEVSPPAGETGGAVEALTPDEHARFERGRLLFDRDHTVAAGLGPLFNGDSCRGCHFQPQVGGAGPPGVDVIRQGIVGPDGVFRAPGGGTAAPHYTTAVDVRPEIDGESNVLEARQAPPLFGLGLIEQVPAEAIEALADPDDADGDGISGRVARTADGRIARLGWKLNVPDLNEFLRDALTNEMGVTLPPEEGATFGSLTDDDDVPDPEISEEDFAALLFFMRALAPPPRRVNAPALEAAGEEVFATVGCAACHVPVLHTATGEEVRAYTDVLLHEVLPEGALGIAEGDAGMRELRTAPLWGVRDTAPYLHHGRAWTLEDAIVQHDGEAATSRERYLALDATDRDALLAFLRSL